MKNEERNVDFLNVNDIKRFVKTNPSAIDRLLILDDDSLENIIYFANNSSREMTEKYEERKEDLQLFFALYSLTKNWVADLSESDYEEFYSKHEGEPFNIRQIDPSDDYHEHYMMNDWALYTQSESMRSYTKEQLEENIMPRLGRIKREAEKNALVFREDMKEIKGSIDKEKLNAFYEMTDEIEKQKEKRLKEIAKDKKSK